MMLLTHATPTTFISVLWSVQAWLNERAAGMARYCVSETLKALQVDCSTPSLSEEEEDGGMQLLDVDSDTFHGQHPWFGAGASPPPQEEEVSAAVADRSSPHPPSLPF